MNAPTSGQPAEIDFGLAAFDVIVPVRNEIHKLPAFLDMIRDQTLQPQRIILVDGMSTDGTRDLLAVEAERDARILVADNPDRVVPTALNVALGLTQAPVVARMDTHALYEPGYLRAVVRALRDHPDAWGVGGAMETAGRSSWGRAIASTLRRPFGLGGARHRVGGAGGPIPHVFSGCYRTERLRQIGGWNPALSANEDFEADTRLRKAGGQLYLEPDARSTWFVRETPRALGVQMWRYGFYKAHTLRMHPDSLKVRQLAPPLLVAGLIAGSIASPRLTARVAAAYLGLAGTAGAHAAHADEASAWKGAAVPAIVHLAWGSGLLAGLVAPSRRRTPTTRLDVDEH